MKIEEVRPSFTVYVIASRLDEVEGLAESLSLAGYMVARFNELTAAFSELQSNPPHFILFNALETAFTIQAAIQQVAAQLPETHILLITPVAKRAEFAGYLETGVYDLILTPLGSPVELIRALDRAAERDYFMYMNERLTQDAGTSVTMVGPGAALPQSLDTGFARRLFEQKSFDDCLEVFLQSTSELLSSCPAVFFKFISNRRVLLANSAVNMTDVDIKGLGLNFNELRPDFRMAHLREPGSIEELSRLISEVFQVSEFFALPVDALGEVQGVVTFLCGEPPPPLLAAVHDCVLLLDRALSLIESEKRLHVMCVKDPSTDLLNRANFTVRLREEISRARRTSLPVSLAILTVDQYGRMVSELGQEEAQVVLKMAARIFEKHSRVNDILGRTGADEFGVILPHTNKQGALVKAERLRRIVESADFSKVISTFPQITISLGVSEYPSMARDAEELIQLADEALYQVRESGNKTCVANPPDGFVADFKV